mmetsp:Transcript_14405/g.45980  ORF Transcript_14405/g.45980 Transcript_14405/m.45980 type:complete len:240 (-) Transcript_14405:141-860(-)
MLRLAVVLLHLRRLQLVHLAQQLVQRALRRVHVLVARVLLAALEVQHRPHLAQQLAQVRLRAAQLLRLAVQLIRRQTRHEVVVRRHALVLRAAWQRVPPALRLGRHRGSRVRSRSGSRGRSRMRLHVVHHAAVRLRGLARMALVLLTISHVPSAHQQSPLLVGSRHTTVGGLRRLGSSPRQLARVHNLRLHRLRLCLRGRVRRSLHRRRRRLRRSHHLRLRRRSGLLSVERIHVGVLGT